MKRIIITLLITLGLLLLFGNHSLYGQLKQYSVEKDSLWYNTYLLGMSKDKNWIHYSTNKFIGDKGAISIKNIESGITFDFPSNYWGNFSDNSKWYSIRSGSDSLIILNLHNATIDTINQVK